MDLSAYGLKSPLRAMYESALEGYRPQIVEQVRELVGAEADEAEVAVASQRVFYSLLLGDDDTLAAFFGDSIPAALRAQPVDLETQWLYHLQGQRLQ